jgi:hypothetical protein
MSEKTAELTNEHEKKLLLVTSVLSIIREACHHFASRVTE